MTLDLFKVYMQFKIIRDMMTSFNDHDLLENWFRNAIELCHLLCKNFANCHDGNSQYVEKVNKCVIIIVVSSPNWV
jgi:hypothetical protein